MPFIKTVRTSFADTYVPADFSNPIVKKGLVGGWFPFGGQDLVDITDGDIASNEEPASVVTKEVDRLGRFVKYHNPLTGAVYGHLVGDIPKFEIADEITLVVRIKTRLVPGSDSFGRAIHKSNGGTGDEWGLLLVAGSGSHPDGELSFRINGTNLYSGLTTTLTPEEVYTVACRYKSGTKELLIDGEVVSSSTQTGSINTAGKVAIGAHADAVDRGLRGDIYHALVFNTFLDDESLESLHRNPYQVLEPEVLWVPNVIAGGPVVITGSGNLIASASVLQGLGAVESKGSGGLQAAPSVVLGQGSRIVTAGGDLQASAPTLTGTGTASGASDGVGVLQAAAAVLDGFGVREINSTGDLQAALAVLNGSGILEIPGIGDLQAGLALLDGLGVRQITSSGDLQADSSDLAGLGTREVTSSGDLQAGSSDLAGLGELQGAVNGLGDLQSDVCTLLGLGIRSITSSGDLQAQQATLEGAGTKTTTGSGDLQASLSDLEGLGGVIFTGSGDLIADISSLAGIGSVGVDGSGTLVTGAALLEGLGTRDINGTGSLVVGFATLVGTGSVSVDAVGDLQAGIAVLFGFDGAILSPDIVFDVITVTEIIDVITVTESQFVDIIPGK